MNAETVLERQLVPTPDGVDLRFQVATVPERALAFLIDCLLLLVANLAVDLPALWLLGQDWGGAIATLFAFASRVFYFAWFETRWNGTTPGKRRFHLRVIRADGGPLTAEVLLARNFTREVEFFLPLVFLLAPQVFWSGHGSLLRLLAGAWIVLLLLFPFGNRHRLRVGDLLAGTRVVVSPPMALLRDLADATRQDATADIAALASLQFTAAQLAVYGIYELQVLEDVLRKARLPGGDEAVAAGAPRSRKRIGWDALAQGDPEPRPFLRAFYQAQRTHLEQALLLGKRKERKEQKPKPPH